MALSNEVSNKVERAGLVLVFRILSLTKKVKNRSYKICQFYRGGLCDRQHASRGTRSCQLSRLTSPEDFLRAAGKADPVCTESPGSSGAAAPRGITRKVRHVDPIRWEVEGGLSAEMQLKRSVFPDRRFADPGTRGFMYASEGKNGCLDTDDSMTGRHLMSS